MASIKCGDFTHCTTKPKPELNIPPTAFPHPTTPANNTPVYCTSTLFPAIYQPTLSDHHTTHNIFTLLPTITTIYTTLKPICLSIPTATNTSLAKT
jgi:hypothetical protein